MRKAEKQEYVSRRARELAESGRHRDYLTIERELASEGFPEARGWLDNDTLRQHLKLLCDKARGTPNA